MKNPKYTCSIHIDIRFLIHNKTNPKETEILLWSRACVLFRMFQSLDSVKNRFYSYVSKASHHMFQLPNIDRSFQKEKKNLTFFVVCLLKEVRIGWLTTHKLWYFLFFNSVTKFIAFIVWMDLLQPYSNNGAKVIFLNQRPQTRPLSRTNGNKGFAANICFTCDRILQEPFRFCSLSCKVHVNSHCPIAYFKGFTHFLIHTSIANPQKILVT